MTPASVPEQFPPKVVSMRRDTRLIDIPERLEVRPVRSDEIDRALELLLAGPNVGETASPGELDSFRQMARRERYDLSKQMVGLCDKELRHAALFIPRPGHTAFLFTSCPSYASGEQGAGADKVAWADSELAAQALEGVCRWAWDSGVKLLQVMVDPADSERQRLCLDNGFGRLTDLIYLVHSDEVVGDDDFDASAFSWLSYDSGYHDLFKSVMLQTYRASLDCPELENLRDIEDVIEGHRGSGQFDRQWWKLFLWQDEPVGVLLLMPLRSQRMMELTYMGLCPAARGRGLGKVLVGEALRCRDGSGNDHLMLAVDCRNKPARDLYEGFGFRTILCRTVFIRSLMGS